MNEQTWNEITSSIFGRNRILPPDRNYKERQTQLDPLQNNNNKRSLENHVPNLESLQEAERRKNQNLRQVQKSQSPTKTYNGVGGNKLGYNYGNVDKREKRNRKSINVKEFQKYVSSTSTDDDDDDDGEKKSKECQLDEIAQCAQCQASSSHVISEGVLSKKELCNIQTHVKSNANQSTGKITKKNMRHGNENGQEKENSECGIIEPSHEVQVQKEKSTIKLKETTHKDQDDEIGRLRQLLIKKSEIISSQNGEIENLNRKLGSLINAGLKIHDGQNQDAENTDGHNSSSEIIHNDNSDLASLETRITKIEDQVNKLLNNLPKEIETQVVKVLHSYEENQSTKLQLPNSSTIPKWKLGPTIKPKSNLCSNYRQNIHGPNSINNKETINTNEEILEERMLEMEKIVENLKHCCLVLLIKIGKL